MEERILWIEIKCGDKFALKQLHEMYFHQMYLYAAKLLPNNNGLAEELVSDCFIKLWENRKNIQITHSVKHYLFTMLRNSVIDNIRKKKLITEPLSENLQTPS